MGECDHRCDCKKGVSRREVFQIGAGLAAAGVMAKTGMAAPAPGSFPPSAQTPPSKEWFDALMQRGKPPTYTGESLKQVALPLGGIGTGTVWLHGSGRLTAWQIFNNINKSAQVDDSFFAIRIEQDGKPPVVRALQLAPVGPFKPVQSMQFTGQYPFAVLEPSDPELPVRIRIEAFNPLIPLNDRDSGIPCAIFRINAINTSKANMRVTFMASMQNAVGHQGLGASVGVKHPTYGRNVNNLIRDKGMFAIGMLAEPGQPGELDRPMTIHLDHNLLTPTDMWPVNNLTLRSVSSQIDAVTPSTVFFVANGDIPRIGGGVLASMAAAVKEGATLILAGVANPLQQGVKANVPGSPKRDEVIFADFEGAGYAPWKVEGAGFGTTPAHGTLSNQNPVSGFLGGGLVNTFNPSDAPQGKLISPIFRIEKKLITFLIGGGNAAGKTCMNLRVGSEIVRTAVGKNDERLDRQSWDVQEFIGKEGVIEIVDASSDGWGHINVDDIRFANLPSEQVSEAEANAWNEILPAVFEATDPKAKKSEQLVAVNHSQPELAAVMAERIRLAAVASRKPVRTQHDARTLLAFEDGSPALITSHVGKGRVIIIPADIIGLDESDPVRRRDATLSLVAGLSGVKFTPAAGRPSSAPSFGTMCLATQDPNTSCRIGWQDRQEFYDDFVKDGLFDPQEQRQGPTAAGTTLNAAMCSSINLGSDAAGEATFVLSWHFPNQYYPQESWRIDGQCGKLVGNMYVNWYRDAASVASYVFGSFDRLWSASEKYRQCLYEASSLPHYLVDCIGANVSIVRSPTCFWTKDGTFYGFEGCSGNGGGCCPLNCNHVWNYEQALAKLWPAIERDMRITELVYNQLENGGTRHRVGVPRDNPIPNMPAVADGQCGAVLKAYREHLQSAGSDFLARHWPRIKKAMDYAITQWDADGDGVMERPQFNTYDRDIFGKNTFVSSLYLAALRAAEEMAKLVSDAESAKRYRKLFDSGRDWIAKNLFDGEYYFQIADNLIGGYGKGCCADQLVGQWWARVLNLGDILPNDQVKSAMKAVYKYCWLTNMNGFEGTQRYLEFANREDKGLLIAAWPKGGRPDDPIYYRDEMWTGVEYQVAAHKIYEEQLQEALAIVKGARERYAGRNKNPWNEIECGDYYARALSSWSLLLAAQGYEYDGPAGSLGFAPRMMTNDHRSFFSTAEGWGLFEQKRNGKSQRVRLALVLGRCELNRLSLSLPPGVKQATAKLSLAAKDITVDASVQAEQVILKLKAPLVVNAGQTLEANIEWTA